MKNAVHRIAADPAPLILAHGTIHDCTSSILVNLTVTLRTFMIFSSDKCISVLLVYVLLTAYFLSMERQFALAALFQFAIWANQGFELICFFYIKNLFAIRRAAKY